jgi:hypothetical protein
MVDCQYEQTTTEVVTPDPTQQCERTDPICGNGVVDIPEGEECDDGIAVNGTDWSNCSVECLLDPYCGDGIVQVDLWEECDPWMWNETEYCDEPTCKYLENVPREFDITLWDPVPCEGHFNGGITVDDEDFDFSTTWMYLEAKCPGSDVYVPLNPEIDEYGVYLAEIEYTDLESPRFLVGECHIRYGGWYKGDPNVIHKSAYERLEWICPESSWSGGWWRWGPYGWGPYTNPSSWGSNSLMPTYSSFYDVYIPEDEVFFNSAPLVETSLFLNPSLPVPFPLELSETWGYFDF